MNFEEFKEWLKETIRHDHVNAAIIPQQMPKVNGPEEGWAIRPQGQNLSAVIYPKLIYQDYMEGISTDMIRDSVNESINSAINISVPKITKENAQDHIFLSLVNKDRNEMLLQNCPHEIIGDMAAIPRWRMGERTSCAVTTDLQRQLKMTKEEVLQVAADNTEKRVYSVKPIAEAMRDSLQALDVPEDIIEEMLDEAVPPLWVITTTDKVDGSSSILSRSAMRDACAKAGCSAVYVLPSSRHECLLLPDNMADDPMELKSIVMHVNGECISEQDFLSDNVYHFDALTQKLTMVTGDLQVQMDDMPDLGIKNDRGMRL